MVKVQTDLIANSQACSLRLRIGIGRIRSVLGVGPFSLEGKLPCELRLPRKTKKGAKHLRHVRSSSLTSDRHASQHPISHFCTV